MVGRCVVSVIGTTTRSFLLYGMKLNRVGISSLRIVNYFWTSRLLGKCAKLFQTQSVHQSVSHSASQSVKCPVIASQSICGSFRLRLPGSGCLAFLFLVSPSMAFIYDLHKKSLANSFPYFYLLLSARFRFLLPPDLLCLSDIWTFHLRFSMRAPPADGHKIV